MARSALALSVWLAWVPIAIEMPWPKEDGGVTQRGMNACDPAAIFRGRCCLSLLQTASPPPCAQMERARVF